VTRVALAWSVAVAAATATLGVLETSGEPVRVESARAAVVATAEPEVFPSASELDLQPLPVAWITR